MVSFMSRPPLAFTAHRPPPRATASRAVRQDRVAVGLQDYDSAVRLTDWEQQRLTIFTAAELARRPRAAGLRLNAPEAIALMCDAMFEAARSGASYPEVEAAGRGAVAPADVVDGVPALLDAGRLPVLIGAGPPPRPPPPHHHGHNPRQPHRARLVALPVRPGQRAARIRPRRRAWLPARPARRLDAALGTGRDTRGDAPSLRPQR